jgi:hypothetical protein
MKDEWGVRDWQEAIPLWGNAGHAYSLISRLTAFEGTVNGGSFKPGWWRETDPHQVSHIPT